MMIPVRELRRRHGIYPTGVIHVGAHTCEEADAYRAAGWTPVSWVEANPELTDSIEQRLARFPGQDLIAAGTAVTDTDHGETVLHVTNNVQSSSIYELGTHRQSSPDVHYTHDVTVATRTLDSLVDEHGVRANFANLDTQGAEGPILFGGEQFVTTQLDYLYCEVNLGFVYEGIVRFPELVAWLDARDLWLRDIKTDRGNGWGDALFVRKGLP